MYIYRKEADEKGLAQKDLQELLLQSLEGRKPDRVLIIPPDFTRYYSNAGAITNFYYHILKDRGCDVDILIAQGTHEALTEDLFAKMYGDIPYNVMVPHRWREDTVKIGEVPADYIREVTEGIWDEEEDLPVEVNRRLMDPSYDLVLSVGQVVPHEVIGMANHAKNIFVGVGGRENINKSHMIGAVFGMERVMGKDFSPVRKIFDYSLEHFLKDVPILFVLTVTTAPEDVIVTHAVMIGDERIALEDAIREAQKHNLDFLDRPIRKCVVYMNPDEFHTTWVANKSIYRTRMAMADGGELIVLAPGVRKFGEDPVQDEIIRKYGYPGRLKILELFRKNKELRENMGTAAHLIHGSSDGRFTVTYAVKEISRGEIESVHFQSASYDEMIKRYPPEELRYGWNLMPDGEEIFFIPNPALGLWADRSRFI